MNAKFKIVKQMLSNKEDIFLTELAVKKQSSTFKSGVPLFTDLQNIEVWYDIHGRVDALGGIYISKNYHTRKHLFRN